MSIAGQDGWSSTELDTIDSVESHHVERGTWETGTLCVFGRKAGLDLRPGSIIREVSGMTRFHLVV
ncbi:uncharacterized protein N7473_008807 [Penicillium subrubescens]|uniref:uncharacterized protein n=1 Tax=Penicillium subrubescens TaxID=1316194 RepID=UPI002544E2E5|nr:uncharacterized protein N7473_008807 [Penicillium subrubescens]KAJ5886133.1 hypothetical protein N7473_008807 [Penicillium subrubescens]